MTDNKADRNERFEEFKGCRFPTAHEDVTTLLAQINPVKYAQSRNFSDGAVSRLSPYISRGFLSTHQVYKPREITRSELVSGGKVYPRTGMERLLAAGVVG